MNSFAIQPMLKICRLAELLILGAAFMITDAHATSRQGEIEVRSLDGVPCFSITREEENSNGAALIHVLWVSELLVGQSPRHIWWANIPRGQRIRIASKDCFRYGQGQTEMHATAAPSLKSWQIYSVIMGGSTGKRGDATLSYHGDFCLVPGSDEELKVINIPRGVLPAGQVTCRGWLPDTDMR